jgi:polyhydroxyalkanoate synthesis regulator phasin
LTDLVESSKQTIEQWQQNVDDRIRTILPGLGLLNDLQGEVERLARRVEALEALTRTRRPGENGANEDATPGQGIIKE